MNQQPQRGKAYWRSLEELADTAEFREFMYREFPAGALEMIDSGERRHFLKIMGASMALAGFSLSGCRRWPEEQIAPFVKRPEGRAPGVAVRYATAMDRAGVGHGLLVTSHDGRPTKVEGNPDHPMSRGATDTWAQSSILDLYDPARSRHAMQGGEPRQRGSWDDFVAWTKGRFDRRVAVLCEASASPTLKGLRDNFTAAGGQWFEYEPINNDHEVAGAEDAFNTAYRPQYAFEKAKVIVSLDSDFLYANPAMVPNTRRFAQGRRVTSASSDMSRLYVFESTLSVTGANADNRFAVRSADIPAIAARLAAALASGDVATPPATATPGAMGLDAQVLDTIVADLQAHRGEGVVLAGPRQPAEVHVLAHLINERLGNVGPVVNYTALDDAVKHTEQIRSLVQAIDGGSVSTLVIIGGDPAYNAPADLDFAAAIGKVQNTVHLSLYDNATSRLCGWHLPRAHYLEAWGDTRAYDGTYSVIQPMIEPLFGGHSAIELLAMINGDTVMTGYELVRRHRQSTDRRSNFEGHWRQVLHDGYLADAAPLEQPNVRGNAVQAASAEIWRDWSPGTGFELVFTPDNKVYDGRDGNNGWLQEMPDPLTKLTWDNAALIGYHAAEQLGVETGDMLRITHGGRTLEAPALVVPGHHDGSITLPLGYGQDIGPVSIGAGFDSYVLRSADTMGVATGATVERAGGSYDLAMTQDHHAIESIGGKGTQDRLPTIFREANLSEFKRDPKFAKHRTHVVHRLSLWDDESLPHDTRRMPDVDPADRIYAWAMTIDLGSCTGCSACVVACQAENNIPIVGKAQIMRGREMHWIRIDRYFRGSNPGHPDGVALQPVTCMMCENAPCEQVCPVAATTHDKDGLNVMVYNRCVGTRYCSNNCPYKVRRFNYFDYWTKKPEREEGWMHVDPEYYTDPQADVHPLQRMQMNPEVTVRVRGVMEKCTYCLQRIMDAKIKAKNAWVKQTPAEKAAGRRTTVEDGSFTTACAQACPAHAITFGDMADPASRVAATQRDDRCYEMLEEINTKPRTRYLAKVRNPAPALTPDDDGGQEHHG